MTTIILALLAAVGIGGGLAAGGGGGGSDGGTAAVGPSTPGNGGGTTGGGDNTEPTEPTFQDKPAVISPLLASGASADLQFPSFSKEGVTLSNNTLVVTGSRLSVTEGRFDQSESGGYIKEEGTSYTKEILLDDYIYSDADADYFKPETFTTEGYYDERDLTSEPENLKWYSYSLDDLLALGGRSVGLTAGEFGAHTVTEVLGPYKEESLYPFYAYDNNRLLASSARTDTAHYDGKLVGGLFYEKDLSFLMRGTTSLDLNFADLSLTGTFDTKLDGKEYHAYNLNGTVSNGILNGTVSVDPSKQIDSSLSEFDMIKTWQNINGLLVGGVLLQGENATEMVGEVAVSGNKLPAGAAYSEFLSAEWSFGAKEVTDSSEPENPAAELDPDFALISALTDDKQYTITLDTASSMMEKYESATPAPAASMAARSVARSGIYEDPKKDLLANGKLVGDEEISAGSGQYNYLDLRAGKDQIGVGVWSEASGATVNSYLTSANKKEESDKYNTFQSEEKEGEPYTTVYLSGAKFQLSVADFGMWAETFSTGNETVSLPSLHPFILYDDTYAYKGGRTDQVALEGTVLTTPAKGYGAELQSRPILTGDIAFDLNLVDNTFTGSVTMHDTNYQSYNVSQITGSVSDSLVRIDGTAWNKEDPKLGELRGGAGKLLAGKDGLEMVGNFTSQVYMPSQEFIDEQLAQGVQLRDIYEAGKTDYVFGAKEVK